MRDRFLRGWTRIILSRPRTVLVASLLATLAAAVALPGLQVEAGHSKLEDKDNIHQRRFTEFLRAFGSPNMLFAIASGGNVDLRRRLLDRLIRDLPGTPPAGAAADAPCDPEAPRNSPHCVRDVMGRIALDRLKSRGLLYLERDQLKALVDALSDEAFGLKQIVAIDGLRGLLSTFAAEVERRSELPAPSADERRQAQDAMDAVGRFFDELARRLKDPERLGVPLDRALFPEKVQAGIDSRGYLASKDGKLNLAIIRPVDDSDEPLVVVPFVGYVRHHVEAAVSDLGRACGKKPGACPQGPLKLTVTGLPAIVADETETLKRDLALTTVVAISGILALFFYGFRSLKQTLLGMLPLLTGLAWTLAFVRLTFHSLNLVTSAFIVTLLGLGIDFAVHLLSRFNESRLQGSDAREAAKAAMVGAGPGILTGALTTSGAFIALAASRFMAFSQLGIITGVGLVFVLLLTLSMLPALLVLKSMGFMPKRRQRHAAGEAHPRFDLPGLVVRRHTAFVVGGLVIAAAMLVSAQRIPWSYDYMELMPKGLDSVDAMRTLSRRTDFSAEVAGLVADTPEQTRRYTDQLKAKKTIGRVESLVSYLPQDQQAKLKLLARLKPVLAGASRPPREAVDRDRIAGALQELIDSLQDAQFEAKRGGSEADARLLDKPLAAAQRLQTVLRQVPPGVATGRLKRLQGQLLDGLDEALSLLRKNVEARPVTAAALLAELPRGIRERLYNGKSYAIYAYPAKPIWQKAFLEQLVKDLRDVDPEATGFPVTHWETSNSIERGFRDASILALVALVLLLLLDFRSPRYALLALAPLAMGIAWMWGGISLLGIKYNHVNVIAFPLIIGIGVASGVHILHRYRQEGERNTATVVRFTGMAIFLSAATTMVGFGSLTLAHHRGAASLGIVLLLGVGACLATSVLFLPALLEQIRGDRPAGGDQAGT